MTLQVAGDHSLGHGFKHTRMVASIMVNEKVMNIQVFHYAYGGIPMQPEKKKQGLYINDRPLDLLVW